MNTKWIERVNTIKKKFGFVDSFDLVQELLELDLIPKRNKALKKAFITRADDVEKLKKIIKEEEKILNSFHELSEHLIGELGLDSIIKRRELELQKIIEWSNKPYSYHKSKNYPLSDPRCYIDRLVGVFYEGTNQIPVCNRGQTYEEEFIGCFYDFLIDVQPLLIEIGLKMDIKAGTIGKYAYIAVNGGIVKGIKIPSFVEMLKELEIEV
ncbi:TPA: hypothetical protein KLD42_002829 [Legionella pneumophila]|nr:hypothetical protein [Legionella pneumophila]